MNLNLKKLQIPSRSDKIQTYHLENNDHYNVFCFKFQGIENISDYAITFHYVKGRGMYAMEYLIYHLRPYGIISGSQSLNIGKGQKVENKTNTRLGS